MKRVSFEVAKAIKEAGYPQDKESITNIGWYNLSGVYTNELPKFWEGDNRFVAVAPTYLDVWLWLWREKKICIEIKDNHYYTLAKVMNQRFHADSPEEAIISAIEYLVKNNLIK